MKTKLLSVRSVVSEAFSTLFSAAALPLIVGVGLFTVCSQFSHRFVLDMWFQGLQNLEFLLGPGITLFFVGIKVFVFFLLAALFGSILIRISLLITDKKSITWSNMLVSKDVFIRFFCWQFIFLLIIILVLLPTMILAVISKNFDFFMKFAFLFLSVCVLIFGLLFIGTRLSLTSYFLIENTRLIDALKKSWNSTKGYCWKIFGSLLCVSLISVIPIIISIIIRIFSSGDTLLFVRSFIVLKIVFASLSSAAYYLALARIYRVLISSDAPHTNEVI